MHQYIVLGHGSRNAEANHVLEKLSGLFHENTKAPTCCAFLQFAEPTLEQAIEACYSEDLDTITIIPVFLYPGVHIKEDIPRILGNLQGKYPEVTFELSEPIGADPRLIPILQEKAETARKIHP